MAEKRDEGDKEEIAIDTLQQKQIYYVEIIYYRQSWKENEKETEDNEGLDW